ncbi:MAG: hypothetical protein KAX55_16465 [Propionivibrio sp.]|nr:hypothetical protein [Propionivibrio sp.]
MKVVLMVLCGLSFMFVPDTEHAQCGILKHGRRLSVSLEQSQLGGGQGTCGPHSRHDVLHIRTGGGYGCEVCSSRGSSALLVLVLASFGRLCEGSEVFLVLAQSDSLFL